MFCSYSHEHRAPGWKLAKASPLPPVKQSVLPGKFGIRWFDYYLEEFLNQHFPDLDIAVSKHDRLSVFPKATQLINDELVTGLVDIVHARPFSDITKKSQFDTVLIRKDAYLENQDTYGMLRTYLFYAFDNNAITYAPQHIMSDKYD